MKKQRLILILSVLLILLAAALSDAAEIDSDIAKVATEYKLDATLLQAILMQESRLEPNTINHKTLDYGIGGINVKTIKAYKFDKDRLLTDKVYSIKAAAIVLSDFKKNFKHKEPLTWHCRYNIGYRAMKGKAQENCMKYMKAIQKHYE